MQIKDTTVKLTARQKELFNEMTVLGSRPEKITNPWSKVEVELPPEAVAMYDVIIGSSVSLENDPTNETLFATWEEAREVFRANWPKEFMDLID